MTTIFEFRLVFKHWGNDEWVVHRKPIRTNAPWLRNLSDEAAQEDVFGILRHRAEQLELGINPRSGIEDSVSVRFRGEDWRIDRRTIGPAQPDHRARERGEWEEYFTSIDSQIERIEAYARAED